ncbi:MAG: protein-methionine-sulfoxide reductase catalytic subunit MsrP [Magnetospirillum sp.]|nr:protein-methionine-sulfoxide reductase catalytic subunit MsrP [Magnetospirillum sp.]
MLIRSAPDLTEADVTDARLVVGRRKFLTMSAAMALAPSAALAAPIGDYAKGAVTMTETATPFDAVTGYNNFYEFSTSKEEPARLARLVTKPWSVAIEGLCAKPRVVDLEDLVKPHRLEERIYRMRCVEGWSMVIPWIGVPLGDVLTRFEPMAKAKFVEFSSLADPVQMPGVRSRVLDWPYVEGLRIDEAMHPLTFLALGLYGQDLPVQNGAPVRLVVPWKYGFKSAKAIVRIRFVESQPLTSWMKAGPREYGFYSNVNPEVEHPRWSQSSERRIGELRRRETLMFNGYAEQVAGLYGGMDLRRNF